MKLRNSLLIILFFALTACKAPPGPEPEPPDPVRLVLREAGADTTESEPGIDAVPPASEGEMNGIQIQWYNHPQREDLLRYNVYRSSVPDGSKDYRLIGTVPVNLSSQQIDTIYVDTDSLQIQTRYYYYVTAVSLDGIESLPSDTVSYRLIEKAIQLNLNGGQTVIRNPSLQFSWRMGSGMNPHEFILRIERFISDTFHPLAFLKIFEADYGAGLQIQSLEGDSLKVLLPNGRYRWRIDCVGDVEDVDQQYFSGSESHWESFEINWSE